MVRIILCVVCAGLLLYAYIDAQNALMRLRLKIPVLAKDIRDLKEENTHLKYEIELFESPQHLMELARHSEYSHLKQPFLKDILTLPQGLALHISLEPLEKAPEGRSRFPLAISSNH